jgi:predicted RNA binding protein YcfA (HicA-like mRNA interferase family)
MKRSELLRYLRSQGYDLLREGGKHSWWHNPTLNKRSAIPSIPRLRIFYEKDMQRSWFRATEIAANKPIQPTLVPRAADGQR